MEMMDTKVVTETEDVAGSVNCDTNLDPSNAINEISENQSLLHGVQVVVPDIDSENDILDNSFYSELNTSTCSYDSRRSKQRSRRKHNHHGLKKIHYPPQYTAIFLDPNNPVPNGAHLIRPRPSNGVEVFHQQHQFSTFPVAQRFVLNIISLMNSMIDCCTKQKSRAHWYATPSPSTVLSSLFIFQRNL